MKKIIPNIIFGASLIATGCQSNNTTEKQEVEKQEAPKEITIDNIKTLSFKEIDINNDGRFTYDEFDKITKNNGSAEGNTVYAEFDVDGNGIISAKEFEGK